MGGGPDGRETEIGRSGQERNDAPGAEAGKLKRKPYERELARLHVELVKLQQWAVHKGLKICIVFEGRDEPERGA